MPEKFGFGTVGDVREHEIGVRRRGAASSFVPLERREAYVGGARPLIEIWQAGGHRGVAARVSLKAVVAPVRSVLANEVPTGTDPISAVRASFLLILAASDGGRRPLEAHKKTRTNGQDVRSDAVLARGRGPRARAADLCHALPDHCREVPAASPRETPGRGVASRGTPGRGYASRGTAASPREGPLAAASPRAGPPAAASPRATPGSVLLDETPGAAPDHSRIFVPDAVRRQPAERVRRVRPAIVIFLIPVPHGAGLVIRSGVPVWARRVRRRLLS